MVKRRRNNAFVILGAYSSEILKLTASCLYKNTLYKNTEAQILPKIRTIKEQAEACNNARKQNGEK